MNRLDTMVRQKLLLWPTISETRWHVLERLYVGNGTGYEWENTSDGAVVACVFDSEPFDEAKARAAFFRDCDEWEARDREDRERYGSALGDHLDRREKRTALARRRRAFNLENLDLIVFEGSDGQISAEKVIATLYHPRCIGVPDDAEPSFREGAIEVLDALIPALYHAEQAGQDRGWRARFIAERDRLRPPPPPEFVKELLGRLVVPSNRAI